MSKLIQLTNLSKTYQTKSKSYPALKALDLSFEPGECTAIIGPSGCGKSTLLNLLGLLLEPTTGHYHLQGRNVESLSGRQLAYLRNQHFGYLVQHFALIEHKTAWYNICLPFFYSRKKISKAELRQRVFKWMDRLQLDRNLLSKRVSTLSGGQCQRIAFIRALINEPQIILADEPTGALDSENSQLIFDLLKAEAERGKTVILATHNLELAAQCHRVIQLKDGHLLADQRQ